ncbi:MAG: carbohydrate ABC transporter permease [Treponema sp.]|jgi:ABC-type glycerol-3-phosphate transport system permease component|nr:carbohydrate ABC transporter permease [Treponema sp.]
MIINRRAQIRGRFQAAAAHTLMLIFCFLAVFPVYWMIVSSFKNEGEIFSPSLWPQAFTLTNYMYAFRELPILRMLLVSCGTALSQTLLQLGTGILAAYGMIRFSFRGKSLCTLLLSLAWLIPIQSIMIPNYVLIVRAGLADNPAAIILPHAASAFAILNLVQAFKSYPLSIIEAAHIDGASDMAILLMVILPNMMPSISSLGILLFITSWNDYLWPRLVIRHMENAPIQIGLRSFISSDTNLWGSLMAATTVSCIPIFVLYTALQRKIVDSFVKWGLK